METLPKTCETCDETLETGLLIKATLVDDFDVIGSQLILAYCNPGCMSEQIRMHRDRIRTRPYLVAPRSLGRPSPDRPHRDRLSGHHIHGLRQAS
ncbi:hypothetical protein [Streptomyces sp. NPDC055886]